MILQVREQSQKKHGIFSISYLYFNTNNNCDKVINDCNCSSNTAHGSQLEDTFCLLGFFVFVFYCKA